MKLVNKLIIYISLIGLAGCAWISPKRTIPEKTSQFVRTGQVVDPQKLKEGGNVLFVPFKAGPGVEANAELDKVALMIVQGFAEYLAENDSNFSIVTPEDASSADLVIEGYVLKVGHMSRMKRLVTGKALFTLSATGEMTDAQERGVVAVFSNELETKNPQESHKHLGYLLGQQMASFLLAEQSSD